MQERLAAYQSQVQSSKGQQQWRPPGQMSLASLQGQRKNDYVYVYTMHKTHFGNHLFWQWNHWLNHNLWPWICSLLLYSHVKKLDLLFCKKWQKQAQSYTCPTIVEHSYHIANTMQVGREGFHLRIPLTLTDKFLYIFWWWLSDWCLHRLLLLLNSH
jgi:hypothetical protein